MPSQLALIICILFVLCLLRLERKQTPNVSFALWLPTIWFLCISTKPLGAWFGMEGDAEGSPIDQVVLLGIFSLGLIILFLRRFRWSSTIRENACLMMLIGYMFISILWSDIPFTSFKRWIRELIAVVMSFLVLSEQDPRQAMSSVISRIIYILIPFSFLLIRYFPEYGREYGRWFGDISWIGVTMQKNGLGRLCLTSAFFLIWTMIRRWRGRDSPVGKFQTYADMIILCISLYLLRGPENAYSATAITSFAVGLTMFFSLIWIEKRKIYIGANLLTAIMALVIGFGVMLPVLGGKPAGGFTSILGRNDTLTGRTDIWANLLPFVEKQPVFGAGFGSFWTQKTRLEYHVGEAHNGYLDVLLGLGSFGLLLLVMYLLSFCSKAQRGLSNDFDWASLYLCFLLMTVLHNATESSIHTFTSQLSAVILFLAVSNKTVASDKLYNYENWEIS